MLAGDFWANVLANALGTVCGGLVLGAIGVTLLGLARYMTTSSKVQDHVDRGHGYVVLAQVMGAGGFVMTCVMTLGFWSDVAAGGIGLSLAIAGVTAMVCGGLMMGWFFLLGVARWFAKEKLHN